MNPVRNRVLLAAVALVITLGAGLPRRVDAQSTLRFAAYNIKHGQGMDGVVDLERVAEVLRALDADVITLQEIDRGVERTGGVDQAARLGELLGMESVFGDFMPYQGGEYGMAVLSRLPILGSKNHRLPEGAEPRSALEVQVTGPGGHALSIIGIHFYRTEEERLAQAEALILALERTAHPVILVGDFNSTRGDRVMSRLAESWSIVTKDGSPLTFPSDEPNREIDFVLLRPAAAFEVMEHRVIDEAVASDHRPLLVVLRLR